MLKKHGLNMSLALMAILVITVGFIIVSLLNNTTSLVSSLLHQESLTANNAFSTTFKNLQNQAIERAEMIAVSDEVINAIINNDEESLKKTLKNFSVGFDLITLCNADGVVLARTHNDKKDDSVINQKAISVALSTGKGISTIEPGTVIGLSTRGSAAIKDSNGNIIGALTCGHDLSQAKYVDEIKLQNNCEATFFSGAERMNTTLIDENGNRVIGTKANDEVIETVINKKQDYQVRLTLFGKIYECYYSPVIINQEAIGMLFTGISIQNALNQEKTMIILIIIASVLLLFVVLIAVMIIKWISSKTHWYESMLDSIPFPISVTNMDKKWTFINKPVEQMLNEKRKNLIGKPCSSWGAGICNTDNCGINCLNSGKEITFFEQMGLDFQVNISYLNDKKKKKIGHIEVVQDISASLKSQKEKTKIVEKISNVSNAFVSASQEIANGSGSLAQSSMEQAAAIQQLSASISEIYTKTKNNAEMAEKAASLSDTIKGNAEKGSSQMDRMVRAVEEISESSQSISKVIKDIDDIAFQTNILALNAAVEAARAGEHGKGFAVVADEVRNLAVKSAESAKGTGALIANSIEKAQLGVHIAAETSESLKGIVSGINESTRIIKDIASASENQNLSISEINKSIDQVSSNIQQNSITAQESAEASEKMSNNTEVLQQLLENFNN